MKQESTMPRGPISNSHSRHITVSGWLKDSAFAPQVPMVWNDTTSVLQDVAPASISNPVRKDGSRAPGSYSRSVFYANTPEGVVFNTPPSPSSTRVYAHGSILGRGASYNGYLPPMEDAARLLSDTRNKALQGMSDVNKQFNVAAYEARSTVKSLAQFCQKGVHGIRQMYRGLSDPLRRRYKDVAPYNWRDVPSDYLGWLYGLRPISEDIENGLDVLSGMSKSGMAYGFEVRKSSKLVLSGTTRLETLGLRTPVTGFTTVTNIARVGYHYRFPQWWIENTPILTPFSQMYELTRLSFVLDWVLPVGNWIGAMEAAQFDPYFYEGYELHSANEVVTSVRATSPDWHVSVPGFRQRRYYMIRTALKNGGRPVSNVRFPDFRAFLGVNHAAQALSLLTQTMKTPPARW